MNKKKNGNLKYLSLWLAFSSYPIFKGFLESFKVSDYSHEMWYGDKKVAKDMQKEQLENKFEFGLEYLNIGQSILNANGFKFKEISKKTNPQWPLLMNMIAAQGMKYFNIPTCQMNKLDMELFCHSLYKNPTGNSTLRVLNLSKNPILKEGAKTLAQALEGKHYS